MTTQMKLARGLLPGDTEITSAMFSDSLDLVGARDQVLANRLVPVQPGCYALGRARTAKFVPATDVNPAHPYDDAIDFIDGAAPGDLIVIATDQANASAFWGELFSAAAISRGAVGMITDGNVRDVSKIIQLGFAAFSRSARPIDYRGRMKLVETQQPVELGGVTIHPGDIICADDDGAVVVPSKLEAQVLEAARARAAAESTVLSELLAGATLREVWTRHGIL
jgi:4-hydroxy-4-methyl-2-oxoglutarate aldolase